MKTKSKILYLIGAIIFVFACNIPMTRDTAPPLPDQEVLPLPQVQEASPADPPPENAPAPTEVPIVHLTQPGEPSRIRTWATDRSSKSYASEHRAVADGFDKNLPPIALTLPKQDAAGSSPPQPKPQEWPWKTALDQCVFESGARSKDRP